VTCSFIGACNKIFTYAVIKNFHVM